MLLNNILKISLVLPLIFTSFCAFGMAPEPLIAELDNNLESQIKDIQEMAGDRQWYSALLTHNRLLFVSKFIRGFGPRYPTYGGCIETNHSYPHATTFNLSNDKCAHYFGILAIEHEKRNQRKQ